VAPFLVGARQLQGAQGTLHPLLRPARQPVTLAEMDEPEACRSTICMAVDCSTACSSSDRPSASRPDCLYARPKAAASTQRFQPGTAGITKPGAGWIFLLTLGTLHALPFHL
jgi:hypothetical protein